jgi:hypothetical protein
MLNEGIYDVYCNLNQDKQDILVLLTFKHMNTWVTWEEWPWSLVLWLHFGGLKDHRLDFP